VIRNGSSTIFMLQILSIHWNHFGTNCSLHTYSGLINFTICGFEQKTRSGRPNDNKCKDAHFLGLQRPCSFSWCHYQINCCKSTIHLAGTLAWISSMCFLKTLHYHLSNRREVWHGEEGAAVNRKAEKNGEWGEWEPAGPSSKFWLE